MKPIFLIGYMASGKSTLGRALAARHGVEFIDLDEWIEGEAGLTVREIFDSEGEEGFRSREREALLTLALHASSSQAPVVIACGGGTPCFGDNMAMMNRTGLTILLSASRDRLMNRLREGRASRPLIASLSDEEIEAFADAQLESRSPFYSLAHARFDSSLLENTDEIEATVNEFSKRFLNMTL